MKKKKVKVNVKKTRVTHAPWQKDDQEWFAAHPGASWRIRLPYTNEWAVEHEHETHAEIRAMTRLAATVAGGEVWVMVFQIDEGMRIRHPIALHAYDEGDTILHCITLSGVHLQQAEALAARTIAACRAQADQLAAQEDLDVSGDSCSRCGQEYQTGDITWVVSFEHTPLLVDDLFVCSACRDVARKEVPGAVVKGVGIYQSRVTRDGDQEKLQAAMKTVKALLDQFPSPRRN